MSQATNPSAGAEALPNWFRAVCFLLVILLVYNPYLIAPLNADGLNVSHRPSYRATLASSELQHFTPAGTQDAFPVQAGPPWNDLWPAQPTARLTRVRPSQVVYLPQEFWSASLWFRPPPAF
jgi:hypothetical protein